MLLDALAYGVLLIGIIVGGAFIAAVAVFLWGLWHDAREVVYGLGIGCVLLALIAACFWAFGHLAGG